MKNYMSLLDKFEKNQMKKKIPDMKPGDTIQVSVKIKEGERERVQIFEGTLISWQKGNQRSTITVRKSSFGVGVERIFPVHSPVVQKIAVLTRGKTRRARLFYLRKLSGKAAKLEEVEGFFGSEAVAEEGEKKAE